ncbi:hypothetical protein BJ878DRAFT_535021 [Calycina marina]|uniref:U4/U6.U5 small nuclear ribonucleoprotein 27kDa protein domain-containing protein n=1 Tax=Calycina marina TaxID=1763456 RepID=A0A9P7Z2M0_9HELO|nr:hypothetical protein BJ878DRAFT_535021 [Calycina marina]
MDSPPRKYARRLDSPQMWEESERRLSTPRHHDRRDGRRDERRDGREGDRNRKYRDRSPRGDRDHRGGGGRDRRDTRDTASSRGAPRDTGRDGGYDNRGGRQRAVEPAEGGRGAHRGMPDAHSFALIYKFKPNNLEESGRGSRDTRERSRDRRRSRSPQREKEVRRDKEPEKPRLSVEDAFIRDRTATPPVSFSQGVQQARRGSSQSIQDHDRMGTDEETRPLKIKSANTAKAKKVEVPIEEDDEIIIVDEGMAAIQAMMGFGGFGTTQNKKVPGNDVSAVRKEKKTEYRQYMNRVGGFNRPLSPSRD